MDKLKSKAQIKSEKLKAVIGEGKDRRKGTRGIDKKSVTVHKAGDTATTGATTQSGAPNPEELAQINKFTKSPKTADELYVLNTMSANTLPDRDDDYFDKDTLKGFAELEAPFSSVGKSYMVGHDYSNLPQGRIFDVGTAKAEGADFLTNKVYIPKTASNESFIESVDFGVNWAVSVGVLLEAQLCSICKSPQYGGWFFGGVCEEGHFKGAYYDPEEDRTDDWGYIIEAKADDPKAVKALGNMNGAKDFYELSQVFLGAQYFAQVDQNKGFSKALKSLDRKSKRVFDLSALNSNFSGKVTGLSASEAAELPLQHVNPKVADAVTKYDIEHDTTDGTMSWKDSDDLMWSYTPGDEVLCLGKAQDVTKGESDGEGEAAHGDPSDAGEVGTGEAQRAAGELVRERDDEDAEHSVDREPGDGSRVGEVGDLTQESADSEDDEDDLDDDEDEDESTDDEVDDVDDESDDDSSSDSNNDDTEKEARITMDKAAVLAACKAAGLPADMTSLVVDDSGDGLVAVLTAAHTANKKLTRANKVLQSKANLGSSYLSTLKSEAIGWYVKAKGFGQQKGVDTGKFEKMLDSLGDDIELIKSITADFKEQAEAKLPGGVARSSIDADPNERRETTNGQPQQKEELTRPGRIGTVSRIHG